MWDETIYPPIYALVGLPTRNSWDDDGGGFDGVRTGAWSKQS